jgi:hypothetical protein
MKIKKLPFAYVMYSCTMLFLICVLLPSCKNSPRVDFKLLILGEWKMVEAKPQVYVNQKGEVLPPPPQVSKFYTPGFNFITGNVCEDKAGFYSPKKTKNGENESVRFLGQVTKYKIEDDSLRVFYPPSNSYSSQKIVSITNDTLTLLGKHNTPIQFAKQHFNLDPNEQYDKIIISSSGCYGTCPSGSTLISKSGEIIHNAGRFNTIKGYHKGLISKEQFSRIEDAFKKAEIMNLNYNYIAGWTDDETISVSFIKGNKIVKTVRDYGHQSPIEFQWAYTPARFLYQQIHLDALGTIPEYLISNGYAIVDGKNICHLEQSESFYLWNLFLHAREVNQAFVAKYKVQCGDAIDIDTDGRYFRFKYDGSKVATLDIGFDFIGINSIQQKFRKPSY